MNTYQKDYEDFINAYKSGVTGAEEVGKQIAKWGQYFAEINSHFGKMETIFKKTLANISQTNDGAKPITSAKANTLAEATEDFANFLKAKREKENIDRQIDTLTSLQVGIMKEFGHSNNI